PPRRAKAGRDRVRAQCREHADRQVPHRASALHVHTRRAERRGEEIPQMGSIRSGADDRSGDGLCAHPQGGGVARGGRRRSEEPVSRRWWELISESLVEWLIRLCGVSAIIFVFGIFYFVFREGVGLLWSGRFSVVQFLTSIEWYPTSQSQVRYGALALIVGTFSVTLLAMVIAIPFGVGAAIYVSDFCGRGAAEKSEV